MKRIVLFILTAALGLLSACSVTNNRDRLLAAIGTTESLPDQSFLTLYLDNELWCVYRTNGETCYNMI